MAQNDAQERWVDLRDRTAFRLILDASLNEYSSQADKKKLKDVQEASGEPTRGPTNFSLSLTGHEAA
jgi:hypothetical protein